MPDQLPINEESFAEFIEDSISEIHLSQDSDAYLDWVEQNYLDYFPQEEHFFKLALYLARNIWNITPLASNNYRPSPLPELKRNSPCYCHSGKKFKNCCLPLVRNALPIDTEMIWPLLLEEMGINDIKQALATKALPVGNLLVLAEDYREQGMYGDILDILEPIFELPADKMGEAEAFALNFLCNTYDNFEQPELIVRKLELLNRLKDHGSKLIRSEAWQRLAAYKLDHGDKKGSWQAFQTAQRLTPNSGSIYLLEITLLLGEGKMDLAQQRAKIILKQVKKSRKTDEETLYLIDFLERVINDPEATFETVSYEASRNIDKLFKWLEQVSGRKVPAYMLESFSADNSWTNTQASLVEQNEIQADMFEKEKFTHERFFNLSAEKEHCLIVPESIKKLENDWSELINNNAENLWSIKELPEFLQKNPQSFDSLNVINDLLNALWESYEPDESLLNNISLPLAQRAWQIYESLPEQGRMPWLFRENRPLYSAMFEIVNILKLLGQTDEAMYYAKRLLEINPNDNHALRGQLATLFIAQAEYHKVLELHSYYPDDILLETRMARLLSFLALEHEQEALSLWQVIKKSNKHIKRYMTASRIRQPEISQYGITMGGEDEAWFYRESAREIWLDRKGAITWLKKH